MLPCDAHRRDELFEVACQPGAAKRNQRLLVLIENQAVFRTIQTKLMERRAHLRRKSEVGRGALLLSDDHPQLIDDLRLSHAPQQWTSEAGRNHLRRLAGQELGDSGYAVADD